MTDEPNVNELFDLRGQVALITGGTGHLGSAMSRALAEAGATVVLGSRDRSRADAAAAALPVIVGAEHAGLELDQMDADSIECGIDETIERHGRINILVNNGHEPLADDLTTVTGEQFNRQLANATGYFLLARCVHNHAVASGQSASIIMLGSMYGMVGSYPEAYEGISQASPVAYHALKGGVIQMTRHLAVYWARDGVRVNCLSPGPFPGAGADERTVERLTTKSPIGRMGLPSELKGAVVFLASEASSYMTGQNLVIDGGWTAW